MTPLSWFLAFFPALVLGLSLACLVWIAAAPSPLRVACLPLVLYALPLVVHRLHEAAHPVQEGLSDLTGEGYSAWWGSHQIQWIYIAFPALETALRTIPGLFSAWLRAWGSTIGRDVYWTPGIEIADRGLLAVGDRVVFGHRTGLYSHIVTPKRGHLRLYVKAVEIGDGAFLGAGSILAPGVRIGPGAIVPVGTHLRPNERQD